MEDRRVVQESQIEGLDGIKEALSECVSVKNDLAQHDGYSPSQHVFGKAPCRPGSMLDDAEDLGTLEAMTDETSPFWTCCQARAEAKKAFLRTCEERPPLSFTTIESETYLSTVGTTCPVCRER